MTSKPNRLLAKPPKGIALKLLPQVLLDRRATNHFKPEAVQDDVLQAILELTAQAPSGYNIQPWRFIVVRDPENRKRLQKAAMDQSKVGEAPVVVIAIGMKEESKKVIEEVLREGANRGAGKLEDVPATSAQARQFLDSFPMNVWVSIATP